MRIALQTTMSSRIPDRLDRGTEMLVEQLEGREVVEVLVVTYRGKRVRRRHQVVMRALDQELRWRRRALPRHLRRFDAELIQAGRPLPGGDLPLVLSVPSARPWAREASVPPSVRLYRAATTRALPQAAAVLVPSAHVRDELLEHVAGLDADRVHAATPAVPPEFTLGAEEPAHLARAGVRRPYALTLVGRAGGSDAYPVVAALERMLERDVRLNLVIAGGSGYGDRRLVHRVEASPWTGRMIIAGNLDPAASLSLLRGAACVVAPTARADFPLPALEAMACGRAVVAASGPAAEALAGAALTVDVRDPPALADAIHTAVFDEAARQVLQTAGPQVAARYTPERTADETLDVYRRVLREDGVAWHPGRRVGRHRPQS